MTNKTKAAIEEAAKLPTAEETLNEFYPTEYINPSLKAVLVAAIESHTAAHTAALRERVKELEEENRGDRSRWADDRIQQDKKHDGDMMEACGRIVELEDRVNELKAKIASYESAIDGLKKVVDSLYNLKS